MIELIEIHNDDVASITSMIFEDNVRQATWDNWCLLREVDQLLGFLEPDMIAHIQEYFEE